MIYTLIVNVKYSCLWFCSRCSRLCPGRSLSRGVSVQRVSIQEDLCPEGDFCPGGFLSRGVSIQGVSVLERVSFQRVSIQRGLCPVGSLSGRPPTIIWLRVGSMHPTGMHSFSCYCFCLISTYPKSTVRIQECIPVGCVLTAVMAATRCQFQGWGSASGGSASGVEGLPPGKGYSSMKGWVT